MTSVFLWYFTLQIHQQILSALLLQCIQIWSLFIAATATVLIQVPLLHTWIMTLTLPNLPAFTLFSLQCVPHTATQWSLITCEWLCHSSIQNHSVVAHLPQSMGQHTLQGPLVSIYYFSNSFPFPHTIPSTRYTCWSSNSLNSIPHQGFCLFCCCHERISLRYLYGPFSSFRSLLRFIQLERTFLTICIK